MFENRKESFPQREERVQRIWEERGVFQQSIDNRKADPVFTVYDGPPFATGLPHYGHLLAGTIKDVVPRYKTMKGFYVPRRFGWDTHGLPIEMEVEKALKLSGAADIEAFGIDSFNEACREIVLRYSQEWEKTVSRMGRWVDFDRTYMTMDRSFMESVWWVFGELWNKGLVYEGYKVMPFSTHLGTPLSNFEANLNYRDVDDPSVTVEFPLEDDPEISLLVWTTTPWTLPSNLSIMVGPSLAYVKVKKDNKTYIIGKDRLPIYFKDDYEVLETFTGDQLVGKRYVPMFEYFIDPSEGRRFSIIAEHSIGADIGTGLVHAAPAFGEVDFFACQKEKTIGIVCPIDQNGRFTNECKDLEGQYVKDADKGLIKTMKQMGRVFHHGTTRHSYPFCWRSDTPLIYKALSTWFVNVEAIKERLIAHNQHIHWVPDHLKAGRFGKWLENARDWAISRNRYWGTPIPIWRSDDGDCIVISSIEELNKRTGSAITDLHRHYIDHLTFEENGKIYRRVTEVFDCWFESGSMPYAQNHYPFENQTETLKGLPADFIAEGLDQTRAWFYTLNILSTALFDKPAFKHVIVNGIILSEDGTKMSKRLKNYPDPHAVINKYGADAIRLYLLNSPAVSAEDLRFSERGVELVLRQFLIPLWNAYVFLSTYANIYSWKPDSISIEQDIDRWILSKLQQLIKDVETGMDRYVLSEAVEPFVTFIGALTNWYIRRNRGRFWADKHSPNRDQAFQTLYTVMITLSKIAAPFVPFISDAIYQDLRADSDPISVHLCRFPDYDPNKRDEQLEEQMACVQSVVSMGHFLRKEHRLKVRQPLSVVHIISSDSDVQKRLKPQGHLIMDELNVKRIQYHHDETTFVDICIKPNFKVLGPKVGKHMKQVHQAILALSPDDFSSGSHVLIVDGNHFTITSEDISIERAPKEGIVATTVGTITVVLDATLNEQLKQEGVAREIVNKINTQRREMGLEVSDRIQVVLDTNEYVKQCFELHKDYINQEVLATDVLFKECSSGKEWELNGHQARIAIAKQ